MTFDLALRQGKLLITEHGFLCSGPLSPQGTSPCPSQDALRAHAPFLPRSLMHVGSDALMPAGSHTYVRMKLGRFLL